MPTNPRIPREMILQTAMDLLLNEGYRALNIKSISKALGCSTQPVSWHFGSMDGLRQQLAVYAQTYAEEFLRIQEPKDLFEMLELGRKHLQLSAEQPKLYSYLFRDRCGGYGSNRIQSLTENAKALLRVGEQPQVLDLAVYLQGVAFCVAEGSLRLTEEELENCLQRGCEAFLRVHDDRCL